MRQEVILGMIGVVLLLALSGCLSFGPGSSSSSAWDLDLDVGANSSGQGTVQVEGDVTLYDRQSYVTLRDVRVVFVADNGSILGMIDIGRFQPGERYHATFVANVSTTPKEVRLKIGTIENPQNTPFDIKGERRESRDPPRYHDFAQDTY